MLKIKQQLNGVIVDATSKMTGSAVEASGDGKKDTNNAKVAASTMVSRKFLEWLMTSDKAQKVLDLVRIDSEKNYKE